MSYEQIFENVKELHKINFNEIISVKNYSDSFSPVNTGYHDYKFELLGCCHKCEEATCNGVSSDSKERENGYKLQNVSHGSHTIDFLKASGMDDNRIDDLFKNNSSNKEEWDDTPVLFLMENPSIDYDNMYVPCNCDNFEKRPTNTWYWIHNKKNPPKDIVLDDYLRQGQYGDMVYALICHYHLANAYLTNVIKCGMNKTEIKNGKSIEKYLGTNEYDDDCKRKCMTQILLNEIATLTNGYYKLKIFAFGGNAYWLSKELFQNINSLDNINIDVERLKKLKIQIVQLPHPSSRLSNSYRKYIVKGIMNDMLRSSDEFALSSLLKDGDKIDDNLLEFLKESCQQEVKLGTNFSKDKYIVCKKTMTSLLEDCELIKEFIVKMPTNNSTKIGFGYNFVESEFWAWDYTKSEYISTEMIELFDVFKNYIEKLISQN